MSRSAYGDNKTRSRMRADIVEMQGGRRANAGQKGGKARLLSLADIDRRAAAYRKTNDLIGSIEADLGEASSCLPVSANPRLDLSCVPSATPPRRMQYAANICWQELAESSCLRKIHICPLIEVNRPLLRKRQGLTLITPARR
jgi:hypothetical protein